MTKPIIQQYQEAEAAYQESYTQDLLRYWLDYNPLTGVFRWKRYPGGRKTVGHVAGYMRKSGYIFIGLRKLPQLGAHRLAWLYVNGNMSDLEIDHIDGNPSNNAIANLRPATRTQQGQNKRVQSNNGSGLKGAFLNKSRDSDGRKKWHSEISVEGRRIFLGCFHTAEEAHKAYTAAAKLHFGEFARAA